MAGELYEDLTMADGMPGMVEQMPAQIPTEELPIEQKYPAYFEYEKASIAINRLITDWGAEHDDARMRFKERYADINIDHLRKSGKILRDETMIFNRVIDNNVTREKTDAMAYLNSGFRLGIFSSPTTPEVDYLRLDIEVTQGLTYPGYYQEFERYVDGAMLHKYDVIEIVFDATKPMKVGFEHIGFENFFFDKGTDDFQKSSRVLRKRRVNLSTLRKFRDENGFNPEVINDLIAKEEDRNPDQDFDIYQVMFVLDKCCYVAWWMKDGAVRQWLKVPEKLSLGIIDLETGEDKEVDFYPFVMYVYREDSQQRLIDKKGRAFIDGPEQEATTAIKTGFVNGMVRASNIYGSPATDDGETAEMKQLDIKLEHGCIYSKPINFFHTDYPDISSLGALQYFSTENSAQLGKTAYSVINRQDSRKTAEELKKAGNEEAKQTGTKLATFSEALRKILVMSWQIIQSQALQGKITLLSNKTEVPIVEGRPELGTQVVQQNDIKTIALPFDIRPAGDTDIVAAAQIIQMMQEDWPIISQFPGLAQVFFQDYLKVRYPKKSQEYIQALMMGDPCRNALAAMVQLVQGFLSQNPLRQPTPEEAQAIMMQIQNAQMLLNPQPQAGQGQSQPQQPQQQSQQKQLTQ